MPGDLARGVTVTAGAARVYSGAPHIHDKSWWDDESLYPLLVGGRTVVHRRAKGESAVWLRGDLSGRDGPEVAQLRATAPDGREAGCETFEGRPCALLGAPLEVCDRYWRIETLDPYGNPLSATTPIAWGEEPWGRVLRGQA